MKQVIFAVMLMLGMGAANAMPAALPFFAVAFGTGVVVLQDAESGIQACYNEPSHLVSWKGQPGYSFTLAGCDYIAKKDLVVSAK